MKEIEISVIVPLYKGSKYVCQITEMVSRNASLLLKEENKTVELIFVNDYPFKKITIPNFKEKNVYIKLVENEVNSGIHQTRVNGLKQANGKYILFLDQDDMITDNCLISQYKAIKNADIVVGNGYRMFGAKKSVIYKDKIKQKLVLKEKVYLKAANQIVSPGHCLIKKEAIPNEWCQIIIKHNGGDDMFLWLLLFSKSAKMSLNSEKVYTHVDTGTNVSSNLETMIKSAHSVIDASIESKIISKNVYNTYKRRIEFLESYYLVHSGMRKIIDLIKYFDIVIWKLYARLV